MRRSAVFGIVALVGAALVAPVTGSVATAAAPDRDVIVMLKDSAPAPEGVAADHGRTRRARVREVYTEAIRGYAAKVPADQIAALKADARVEAVVENKRTTFEKPKKGPPNFAQLLPFTIDRIDGDLSSTKAGDGRGRVDVDVAVIDTGVGPHNDLNIAGGVNCGTAGTSKHDWADEAFGHGTGVAGVIGALDNDREFVGVAPGARIWSVRVDNDVDTDLAAVLCGIDWVAKRAKHIEVANMSIAFIDMTDDRNCGRTNRDPMHRAICRLVAAGVTVAAAAGNESMDTAIAAAPAMYDEVIAVAAMADFDGKPGGLGDCPYPDPDPIEWCLGEVDDTRAFFSNFGTDIDMTAPGVIVETLSPFGFDSEGNFGVPYPDGWQLVSGTSFSSPHVAGAAALYKSRHPRATPAQVKAALIRAGTYDYDNSDDPDGIKEPLLNVGRF